MRHLIPLFVIGCLLAASSVARDALPTAEFVADVLLWATEGNEKFDTPFEDANALEPVMHFDGRESWA